MEFKPNTSVVCVSARGSVALTRGKVYHLSRLVWGRLQVKNDDGEVVTYSATRFRPQETPKERV